MTHAQTEGQRREKTRKRQALARKRRATRNLRHGLAAISRHGPTLWPEIERMAKAICNGDDNPLLFEQAIVIAETEIVLRCVRLEKLAVIERLRDPGARPLSKKDDSLARAKARFRLVKFRYKRFLQAKPNDIVTLRGHDASQGQGSEANQSRPTRTQKIKTRDEFDALRHAMPDLERLARYERRAWSRQKRAIREFIAIKLNDRCSEDLENLG